MTYGIQQIKERYGVSEHTVLLWIKQGELRAINVSRRPGGRPKWKVTEEALQEFELLRQSQPPPSKRRWKRQDPDVIQFI